MQVMEAMYGQDLDSGHHGSGFPLPPFRQKLLEEHLRKCAAEARAHKPACTCNGCKGPPKRVYTSEEEAYSQHCWNINNLPRCKVQILTLLWVSLS